MGMDGLSRYLEGPSVLVWGGDGVAELAKEVSTQVKTLKKPEIKGGAVDGVVIGPDQVEDITKLPSREQLIGRVVSSGAGAGATDRRPGQRAGGQPDGPAEDAVRGRTGAKTASPQRPRRPPRRRRRGLDIPASRPGEYRTR